MTDSAASGGPAPSADGPRRAPAEPAVGGSQFAPADPPGQPFPPTGPPAVPPPSAFGDPPALGGPSTPADPPVADPPVVEAPVADAPVDGPRHARELARQPQPDPLWERYRARRKARKARKAAKPPRKAPWWELPLLVIIAILIAIVVKSFVVQPFYIPSESMEKTLAGSAKLGHDRILVNKLVYDIRDPHPGDIVVFHAPKGWDDEPATTPPSNPLLRVVRGFGQLVGVVPPDGQVLVKRVIAVGGQTVKENDRGEVMVSDKGPDGPYRTLDEPYVYIDPGQASNNRGFDPVTVPKGRLWVMGDHRNDSADSRFHCGADAGDNGGAMITDCNPVASTVPVDDVIGKAFVVAWPPSHWRTLGTPATFESLAAGPALPTTVSVAVVGPTLLIRRRRRRRVRR